MGIWARIFGSSDVIKQAADGIYNGVDAAWYTDEEKAKGFLALLKNYEPFKLAQRLLALAVTVPYVLVWIMCAGLMLVSPLFDPGMAKHAEEVARTVSEWNDNTLGFPVSLVLGFYFGGGAVEGIVQRWRDRK